MAALRKRSPKTLLDLKPYLDEINDQVERSDYIDRDPVQFLHAFSDKKDMEIAGFFAATMAWGRRDIVVAKVDDLLRRMDYRPYQFTAHYGPKEFPRFATFRHRTFKPVDIHTMLLALQRIYAAHGDLEQFMAVCYDTGKKQERPFLAVFHEEFFRQCHEFPQRTRKHVSNPEKGSTCKRLYMFLRWCIRRQSPVDPGIWSFMNPSELLIPFDVHVARQARRYGLLGRLSNNWRAVNELTGTLRLLNPDDPARYDFALFGIGALGYTLPARFSLNKVY